jgi:FAD/FMN-containing dehydrogenase
VTLLIDRLRSLVGAPHVLTREDGTDLSAWEQDWRKRCPAGAGRGAPRQHRRGGRRGAGLRRRRRGIVPQGGNTGLVVGGVGARRQRHAGAAEPAALNRVRAIDAANLTHDGGGRLRAAGGAGGRRPAGCCFPLSLAAEGSCTIGGNLATNAGGTQVLRYGNARDLCLGLEVVTAQGEVWHGLSGLRKDNTGYDLRDLFIGSEGTLGIITAATLKLYPQPGRQLTAWAAVPTLDAPWPCWAGPPARLGAGLTGFEVMGQFALSLVDRHFPQLRVPLWQQTPFCVLLENSDSESEAHARGAVRTLLESAGTRLVTDAVVAESLRRPASCGTSARAFRWRRPRKA